MEWFYKLWVSPKCVYNSGYLDKIKVLEGGGGMVTNILFQLEDDVRNYFSHSLHI